MKMVLSKMAMATAKTTTETAMVKVMATVRSTFLKRSMAITKLLPLPILMAIPSQMTMMALLISMSFQGKKIKVRIYLSRFLYSFSYTVLLLNVVHPQ